MKGAVHIGTSGWHYKHWRGAFYPQDLPASKMLAFYLQHFNTVEINNSFYRLPAESSLKSWREAAPENFCFAVKGSRFLTHMKKLKDPQIGLGNFLPRVEILAEKLGPILFQTPPWWECNAERLANFLAALPGFHRYSFELRNPTWHNPEIYALLRQYNAAFCAYDLAGFLSPIEVTADFSYVRLHGPGGAYQGSYDRAALENWASRISEWRRSLRAVYVYFDNDQAAFAVQNARDLRDLVEN